MFELVSAHRLFKSNLIINLISATLIGTCIFAYGLVFAAIREVKYARTRCGEIAEAKGVYYYEAYDSLKPRYEIINELYKVKGVCYKGSVSGKADGKAILIESLSSEMYNQMPLELSKGKWPLTTPEDKIYVVATANCGYDVGEEIIIDIEESKLKVYVAGILSDDSDTYRFSGFTKPMTFSALFTEKEDRQGMIYIYVNETFLSKEITKYLSKPNAVVVLFEDDISESEYNDQVQKLESKGNVFTLDEIRKNTMLKEQEYKNLFMPSVSVLSLMAVCSSLAAVLITVKKSEKHLRIMKLIGASPLKVAVTMELLSVIMAVIAVFVSFLLWKTGTAFLMLSGSAVNVCYAKSVFGVLAAYLLAQTALVAAISQKGVKQIELGGREE